MKKMLFSLPVVLTICLLSFSQVGLTSCEKETEIVHDTVVVVHKDTVIFKDTLTFKDTVTVTLQPCDNRFETNIASIWQGNNINLQELPAFYWTYEGTPYENRSLLKFSFSEVPTNRTILNAKLSLYAVPNPINGNKVEAHSGSENAVLIQRITANWDTATLSWANQPATTSTNQIELGATSDHFKNYVNLDATKMVNDMFQNGNYGMMVKIKNRVLYNIQNFASSKHANCELHPKLVITYTRP